MLFTALYCCEQVVLHKTNEDLGLHQWCQLQSDVTQNFLDYISAEIVSDVTGIYNTRSHINILQNGNSDNTGIGEFVHRLDSK
jgi:hypothetical protein